ncbi:right-handed parallel beta-helix repeat-containing protein [Salinibacterium xinjiangense]|nr:right-handed parallel beta-helix repeat-containing protein [Salinibacterium xinjiangense]
MMAGQGIRLIAVATLLIGLTACGAPTPKPSGDSKQQSTPESCASPTEKVATSSQLADALTAAKPGASILLAPGIYAGRFIASVPGTKAQPISLCGPADAILDGGGTDKGYVFHLDGVSNWILDGFTVRGGQKGVMADGVTDTIIRGLTVTGIGDEAIHLRAFSTDNVVTGNTINATGLRKPKFGEGIYIGTAESNWCSITNCEPDKSDRNTISHNTISETTAESVDIKEGTSDGILSDNRFDGASISGGDSWVDVKGNDWLIVDNKGSSSPLDGFQTHEILDGWGTGNVFRSNTADVMAGGFGFSLTPELGNVVECSNTATNAQEGVSNVDCAPGSTNP